MERGRFFRHEVRPEALVLQNCNEVVGELSGTWSRTVTRNHRLTVLTFRIDIAERELCDLNVEDYH